MSSMDFLKSCATNVRMVEDLFQMQYSLYLPLSNQSNDKPMHQAVTDLRKHNILCAALNGGLWIFGRDGEDLELQLLSNTLKDSFVLEDSNTVGGDPAREVGGGWLLKNVLLDAIEGSISFTLAQEQQMLHIASWQWLFCPVERESYDGVCSLIRLYMNLTDSGTLYISTTTHNLSLWPVESTGDLRDVLLAPSGRLAKLARARVPETAHSRKPVVGNDAWKSSITEVLANEGIKIEHDDDWIMVELSEEDETHRVLWPRRLCLTSQPNTTSTGEYDWKYWFPETSSNDVHETYQNPLVAAEEWFMNSAENSIRHEENTTSLEHALTSTSMIVESPLATSPPFNQRTTDHQAAMSGIYPTPPDGLMPAHIVAHHSSTDDALRAEANAEATQILGSDDTQNQLQGSQSLASSAEPQSYLANSLAVDDLFGDMGAMDDFDPLGTNEVGEADFDYFDEPDELDTNDPVGIDAEKDVEMVVEQDAGPAEVEPTQHQEKEYLRTNDDGLSEAAPVPEAVELSRVEQQDSESKGSAALNDNAAAPKEPENPLSPFRIRERLLPPPIPASANQRRTNNLRRSSTYDPIIFNESLDNFSAKYVETQYFTQNAAKGGDENVPNISLPQKRKKHRVKNDYERIDSGVEDPMEISQSSEEDSYEDTTSLSESEDEGFSPRLPWDTKKRKRDSLGFGSFALVEQRLNVELIGTETEETASEETTMRLREALTSSRPIDEGSCHSTPLSLLPRAPVDAEFDRLPSIEEIHGLTKPDLVCVAQVISEQAFTSTTSLVAAIHDLGQSVQDNDICTASTVRTLAIDTIDHVLSSSEECNLARLALVKEPLPRNPTNSGNAQAQRPRPQHFRENSLQLGPDYFAIPPPYVRIQRGVDTWEVLPPALSFWSALGLGPANGAKDVKAICVLPENEGLLGLATEFLGELGRAYESCRLGSFSTAVPTMADVGTEMEEFQDGVVVVAPDESLNYDLPTVLKEYASVCIRLGKMLAKIGHLEPNRTIAICIVNPFEGHEMAEQHLCASFWLLYTAYRDSIPKAQRNVPRSDLVLQILPISLIASTHGMVMLDPQQIGILATEMYDRCPPSAKEALDSSSSLSILAAPAVELASMPPKRIGFQLSADPPSDLLHEGSILHLAYAVSRNGEWITVCWIDSTGRYQRTASASFRGKSLKTIAMEIWEQTMDIIAAREVMWRVFIVASQEIDESIRKCWSSVVRTKPRKQMLHVTLLTVDGDPALQLSPSPLSDGTRPGNNVSTPGGGFLTPASTPQAATFTVSPDASGQTTAPPTPAPSDTAATIVESDPDAHLLDLTDESWAMLLGAPFTSGTASTPERTSASGILFRRGDGLEGYLETLGIELLWDIRVRPNGLVDEGPQRQVEANLREVLKMYRSLSLLARARHVDGKRHKDRGWNDERRLAIMPIHVISAVNGAEALDGLLR